MTITPMYRAGRDRRPVLPEDLRGMVQDAETARQQVGSQWHALLAAHVDRLADEVARLRNEHEWHRMTLSRAIGAPLDLPWPVLLNRTGVDYAALIAQRRAAQAQAAALLERRAGRTGGAS
ncbi:hypothetical protein [Actinomadura opuntiae]|uniref:hypothetical protein n=1 Tax=Actinomadura sp. OS1-43 TaxID=604315 RepID=UPI00255AC2D2|nr:hypothetical protein [Actinomadura sp. OS1-43]MDL4812736.1 hypothetical protein [Actinomadura sp. OS1-43]